MGAAHSSDTRSVSMDNPTPGVIDISDEVVQRLKKGIAKQAKENVEPKPSPKQEPPRTVAVKSAPPAARAAPPTVVYQNASPVYMPASGPTLTATDVRRQKEIELQQNDAMWRQRMTSLEVTLNKTNAILEDEYSAAMEDVRKRFATAAPTQQLPPCQDLKAKLIACYRANPGETLKCSAEVALFRNCVNMHRIKKLDDEGKADQATAPPTKKPLSAEAVKAG